MKYLAAIIGRVRVAGPQCGTAYSADEARVLAEAWQRAADAADGHWAGEGDVPVHG